MTGAMMTRRAFVAVLAATTLTVRRGRALGPPPAPPPQHPTPRPGVDASKILSDEQLHDHPDAVPVFARAREIPQILDGIRCQCGCSDLPDKYSLLSCFEGDGMAAHCEVCQGQTKLAHRLSKAAKTLDEIRSAIEERYG